MGGTVTKATAASILLFILSCASCHYGPQYALNQRTREEIEVEQFTISCINDPAVSEWEQLGVLLFLASISTAISAVVLWAREAPEFAKDGLTPLGLARADETGNHEVAPATPPPAAPPAPTPHASLAPPFQHFDACGRTPLERVFDERRSPLI